MIRRRQIWWVFVPDHEKINYICIDRNNCPLDNIYKNSEFLELVAEIALTKVGQTSLLFEGPPSRVLSSCLHVTRPSRIFPTAFIFDNSYTFSLDGVLIVLEKN